MITSRGERTLNYVVALLFATASIAPLVGVLLAALHPPGALLSGISLPETLSLDTIADDYNNLRFESMQHFRQRSDGLTRRNCCGGWR